MLLIGLTGSIATGKSTVSSLLSQPPYSLPIIDADLLAREVVEPGTPGYKAIVAHFGPSTPDLLVPTNPDDGMPEHGPSGLGRPLNRPALGRRVFGDDPARRADRAALNGIVHPAVRRAMARAVLGCYVRGCRAVVLDVPLLFESRLDRFCGAVMVVAVKDPEVQMERLRRRDPHLSREDAENRVRSQGDVREKARSTTRINLMKPTDIQEYRIHTVQRLTIRSLSTGPLLSLTCPSPNTTTMPPHSVFEWIVGQNLPRERRQPPKQQFVRVEMSTDDEADTDSVTITYPRSSATRRHKKHRRPKAPSPPSPPSPPEEKRVTFRDKPLKSALKKPRRTSSSEASPNDSSGVSSEEFNDSSEDESSEEEPKPKPKPKKKKKKAKKPEPSDNEASSGDESPEPEKHNAQNCSCTCCLAGLMLLTKMDEISKNSKSSEAAPAEENKPSPEKNGKGKQGEDKGGNNGKENKGGDKGGGKGAQSKKGKKEKEESETEAETDTSAATATSAPETATESEPEAPKSKKNKKENENKQPAKNSDKPKEDKKAEAEKGGEKKNEDKAKDGKTENTTSKQGDTVDDKKSEPQPHPNLILPARDRNLQVQHVVEDPARDTPPNAYFDNDKNVCRVYHGPYWGYPYGQPYPPGGPVPQYPAPGWPPVPDTQAMHGRHPSAAPVPPGYPPVPQPPTPMPYPAWGQPYGPYPPIPPPYGSAAQRPVGLSGIPGSPSGADALRRQGFALDPLYADYSKTDEKDNNDRPYFRMGDGDKKSSEEQKSAKGSGVQWNTPKSNWEKLPSNKSRKGSNSGNKSNHGNSNGGNNGRNNNNRGRNNHGNSNENNDNNNGNENTSGWGNNNNTSGCNNNNNDNSNDNNTSGWGNNNNDDSNDNNQSSGWAFTNNDNNNDDNNNQSSGWAFTNNNDDTNQSSGWDAFGKPTSNHGSRKVSSNAGRPSSPDLRPAPTSSMPGSWSPPQGRANIKWHGGGDGEKSGGGGGGGGGWGDKSAAQDTTGW
ncbi:dephospho-CoA kinase-domain-containing protein [Chaetomium tenue]|uniref:Dephospho-CoA kinase-domain-containing protein n=1 Tax=Chaetomium tenue TaxID=1854479 RepID=A0ACB7PCL1_9PEZI|nr:dephospho-CoA kinase-domain-containing protein [Chaetomium globosum]